MKKYIILAMVLLSGCTTKTFQNGADSNRQFSTERWHHNVALALVEVSDPVSLERECYNKEWDNVQTQLTFVNGLASWAVNTFTLPLWYPKTVSVACK